MIIDIYKDVGYHPICQDGRFLQPGSREQVRKSNKEAALTREGIVETSLADVMAAAGLTHGGFYKHFRNKEHLIAEALSAAGEEIIAVIGGNMAKGDLNAVVEGYLSAAHRDATI